MTALLNNESAWSWRIFPIYYGVIYPHSLLDFCLQSLKSEELHKIIIQAAFDWCEFETSSLIALPLNQIAI